MNKKKVERVLAKEGNVRAELGTGVADPHGVDVARNYISIRYGYIIYITCIIFEKIKDEREAK